MDKVDIKAPCKVNLFLQIKEINKNNYHELSTIMQTVSLYDEISVEKNDSGKITLKCEDKKVPLNASNTCYKAAKLFLEYSKKTDVGIEISIVKRIPSQAGLGGGSADAAAVLKALNILLQTDYQMNELCDLGAKVGADVPFCIMGGSALAEGIGEKLTPIKPLSGTDCHIVIVKPDVGVSTPEAFEMYDDIMPQENVNISQMLKVWNELDIKKIAANMYNSFERVLPLAEVFNIKFELESLGALGAVLSGSGSSVVGIFDDEEKAKISVQELKKYYTDVFLVHPI